MTTRRWVTLAAAAVVVLGLAVPSLAAARNTPKSGVRALPSTYMPHLFIIMMENAGISEIINPDNPNTAYIQSLAATYGLATDYHGVTHPSMPNYLAATSGSTWGTNSDDTSQRVLFDHSNIVDQLEAAHATWKAYEEGLPYAGFKGNDADFTAKPHGTGNALYLLKHDPFMLYPDVYSNPAWAKNVVPLTQLQTDLGSGNVPQYAWITPDICNDMHGMDGPACPFPSKGSGDGKQLYSFGNAFLKYWVNAIMSSPAWTGNSTIFITWDEGGSSNKGPNYSPLSDAGCCDSPILPASPPTPINEGGGDLKGGKVYGGGRVPMIVIAREGARHYTNATPFNHYSLLRTIEDNFGLSYLGYAGDSRQVQSLSAFLVRH